MSWTPQCVQILPTPRCSVQSLLSITAYDGISLLELGLLSSTHGVCNSAGLILSTFCSSPWIAEICSFAALPQIEAAYSITELVTLARSNLDVYRGSQTFSLILAVAILVVDAMSQVCCCLKQSFTLIITLKC